MRGSEFEFDGVNLLYYDFNKISLNRGGSHIESAKWIKNKSTINPKNNDYKCFQYAVTVALKTVIKLIMTLKGYLKLRLLLTNTIGTT